MRRLVPMLKQLILKKSLQIGRHISQKEIADYLGVSESMVSRWVNGGMDKMSFAQALKLCEYFDCELSDLAYTEKE